MYRSLVNLERIFVQFFVLQSIKERDRVSRDKVILKKLFLLLHLPH